MKPEYFISLFLLVKTVVSQLSQIEGPSEHNLLFQVVVPKGDSRTLFYMHPKGYDKCELKFEYYSISVQDNENGSSDKMTTQLEIFATNNTKLHDSYFKNDDPKFGMQKHELKLIEDGLYRLRITNLDDKEFVTALITGFHNCDLHKENMKHSDMEKLNEDAEASITQLFMNLAKVISEESMVENRRVATKTTHNKLLYGCIGEIFAIIGVAWWQIYYLTAMLDKKMVI